jgi:hypothetical protein
VELDGIVWNISVELGGIFIYCSTVILWNVRQIPCY